MSSLIGSRRAASRDRRAASPPADLLQPGAKRSRNKPDLDQEAMQGESGVESVDAAAEIDPTKGSATASPSRAAVQPAQVQGHVDARYWYNPFYADDREQALTEL